MNFGGKTGPHYDSTVLLRISDSHAIGFAGRNNLVTNQHTNFMRTPYFVFARASSETAFDVMRRTGPRSSVDVLPNFKAKSPAERVANALNQAYAMGKRERRPRSPCPA
jgi:hypothetical protein